MKSMNDKLRMKMSMKRRESGADGIEKKNKGRIKAKKGSNDEEEVVMGVDKGGKTNDNDDGNEEEEEEDLDFELRSLCATHGLNQVTLQRAVDLRYQLARNCASIFTSLEEEEEVDRERGSVLSGSNKSGKGDTQSSQRKRKMDATLVETGEGGEVIADRIEKVLTLILKHFIVTCQLFFLSLYSPSVFFTLIGCVVCRFEFVANSCLKTD